MSYQHDHLAWQQRCGQEDTRRNKFEIDFLNARVQPITQSKFNPKHLHSSYTNYFGNLMTLDDKREVIDDQFDPTKDPDATISNPYTMKAYALKEFRGKLMSNGNYSFGGATPLMKAKGGRMSRSSYAKVAGRPASAQVNRNGFVSITAGSDLEKKLGHFPLNATKGKRKIKNGVPVGEGPSIYDLVTQNLQVPDGLLYRGKYCGKSKMRQRMNEFGDQPYSKSAAKKIRTPGQHQNRILDVEQLLNSVQPRTSDQRSRKLVKSTSKKDHITAHQQLDAENRLRQMKKFYPEEYFQRSGYPYQPYQPTRSQKELIRLKRSNPNTGKGLKTDFERFNEELIYPQTNQNYIKGRDDRLSTSNLDQMSRVSNQSRVQSALSLSKQTLSHLSRKSRQGGDQYSNDGLSRMSVPIGMSSLQNLISPAEILLKIHGGKLMKMAARRAPSSGMFLHPQTMLWLKSISSNEGSLERQGGNERNSYQAIQVLEHFDEQCFLYLDEHNQIFYDADGNLVRPLVLNTIEDLEAETPEIIAVRLDGEKAVSQAPSRNQSAFVKYQRPKSKGYGTRNDVKYGGRTMDQREAGSAEETRDSELSDAKSRTGKSQVSRASDAKTYISNLEADLKQERQSRKHLESEIEQIKQMNAKIYEHLDIPLADE